METWFGRLGDFLLESIFQPILDRLSYHFTAVRVRAACLCLDLSAVGWIVSRSGGLLQLVTNRDMGVSPGAIAVLLIGLIALTSLRIAFRRTPTRNGGNPLRPSMRSFRGISLLMLLSSLSHLGGTGWADVVMALSTTAALYAGACTDGPDGRRILWKAAGSKENLTLLETAPL